MTLCKHLQPLVDLITIYNNSYACEGVTYEDEWICNKCNKRFIPREHGVTIIEALNEIKTNTNTNTNTTHELQKRKEKVELSSTIFIDGTITK